MVIMKVAGRAVAMRDRACLEVLHASAAGLRGNPNVTLKIIKMSGQNKGNRIIKKLTRS